jgi:hypothetical protein
MCLFGALPALAASLGIGGATAAGATAAASGLSFGTILSGIGTAVSVVGALKQAKAAGQAASEQVAQLAVQKTAEANLAATEEQRHRQQFQRAQAQQRAELAARGVSLDSPTAILLGQTLAQEMSFDAQAVRSGGVARQQELTGAQRVALATGTSARMRGRYSAAASLLSGGVDLWKNFAPDRTDALA